MIDLFAGPGGLGEGFESGGRFRISLSIECDPNAHLTLLLRSFFRQFERNREPDSYFNYVRKEITREQLFEKFPREAKAAERIAVCAKLGETSPALIDSMVESSLGRAGKSGNWVLIGGPPCQAYSLVGRSRRSREDRAEFEKDTRHQLYREYLRILAKYRPAVFVMENVKGILSARLGGDKIISRICADLSAAGYSLHGFSGHPVDEGNLFSGEWTPGAFLVKAEEYGIPQRRHRIFILGVRDDFSNSRWNPCTFALSRSDAPTLFETIGALPKLWSALSSPDSRRRGWLKARDIGVKEAGADFSPLSKEIPKHDRGGFFVPGNIADVFDREWFCEERIGGALNHETRTHIAQDISRYSFAAEFARREMRSPAIHEFPKRLLPEHKNIHGSDETVPFADRFRVQLRDQPSTTVTSHISKDGHYYIHYDPEQARSLTVREAARIQTFPDSYFFEGPRTQQYHQVGNAVPPLLAQKIAKIVAEKIFC